MNRYLTVLMVAGLIVATGEQVSTHHSFSATYDGEQKITVEGELVQVLFRNPHSFLHVATGEKDKDGNLIRWAIEWGGTGQLGSQGVTRETLQVGDHVVITGNPGHNPAEHRVRMLTLRRPKDGFTWGGRPGEIVD
jgi:hypothetical protein